MGYKKDKKIIGQVTLHTGGALVICISTLIIFSQLASAHSPSNMVLQYDMSTQTLGVTITHNVVDPEKHYIYKVEIKKNGQTSESSTYTNQLNYISFTYTYQVNATKGDSFEVTASCILGGSLTKQLTVGSAGQNGENTSTPGFEIILVLFATLVMLILYQRRKII